MLVTGLTSFIRPFTNPSVACRSCGQDFDRCGWDKAYAIAVGGGGSNAINYMFSKGIKGVDYVVCNTDAQALENSSVPNKVQLGVNLTEGMGAGADPTVGEQAAIENLSELREMLEKNTKIQKTGL